jgi:mono/diheme cytochrome c family protein
MTPTPSVSVPVDTAEPKAGLQPIPEWIFVGMLVLFYWGMIYFDQNGGWFSKQVYAPYHSEQEVDLWWPKGGDEVPFNNGMVLFKQNCAVCHMENGVGNPANGCPPLIDSEWVKAAGPNRLVRLVSKGSGGPIEVLGKSYNGTMLPIGDQLPGDEKEKAEKIADILFYVRKNFGKVATPIKPEQVAAVREKIKTRGPYTAPELLSTSETEP